MGAQLSPLKTVYDEDDSVVYECEHLPLTQTAPKVCQRTVEGNGSGLWYVLAEMFHAQITFLLP